MLWLDQRGTGLSTPLSPDTLPATVKTDQEIADYLKYFRADSIGRCYLIEPANKSRSWHEPLFTSVKDCEIIRGILLGHKPDPEDQKWSLLGQSFGGFCSLTYLSFYPEGLREVFLTGGLAPLGNDPLRVYQLLTCELSTNLAHLSLY